MAPLLWRVRRLPAWSLLALAVLVMSPLSVVAFRDGVVDHEQNWGLRIACGFTAGALAALAVRRTRRTALADSVALTGLVTCLVLVVCGLMWASWRRLGSPENDYAGVVVVVFPLIVSALAVTERGPARWLSGRAMLYGGRVSYSLYLVHYVVIDVLLTIMWQDPAAAGLTPGLTLAVPGVILLCFAAAVALHHGVEEPGRRALLAASGRLVPERATGAPVPPPPRHEVAGPVPAAVPDPVRRISSHRPVLPGHARSRPVRPAVSDAGTVPRPRVRHPAAVGIGGHRGAVVPLDTDARHEWARLHTS
jgi:peptidoglycan/LPS O-acetylase OafA/YrhL